MLVKLPLEHRRMLARHSAASEKQRAVSLQLFGARQVERVCAQQQRRAREAPDARDRIGTELFHRAQRCENSARIAKDEARASAGRRTRRVQSRAVAEKMAQK